VADVLYVAMLVAFFGLAAAFVAGCDKIIGEFEVAGTQPAGTQPAGTQPAEEVAPEPAAPDTGVPA
jgi:hypothetical protein